jgi:hypothetical protein
MASIGDGLSTAASALASLGAAGAAVDNPHTSRQLIWTIYMGSGAGAPFARLVGTYAKQT